MPKILLFDDINFGGDPPLVVTTSDSNLIPQGWNDRVSSIIVIDGSWNLFDDINYGGTQWSVNRLGGPNGDGTYPDFSDWGGANDCISSLKPG